jgi:ligand-binding sensor domain-containing protein
MRRTPAWACAIALLLAGLSSAVLSAQPRTVAAPAHRQWVVGGWWRQAQGLPQDLVIAIRQTRDGYLWIGTRSGVARFDGVSFRTWRNGEPGNPPEGELFAMADSADGALWLCAFGGGVARYADGRFTVYTESSGLVSNYVRSVAGAADGTVWFATEHGLSALRNGRFTNYHEADGLAAEFVRSVFIPQGSNTVYLGTDRGLQRLADGRFERVPLPGARDNVAVDAVTRDRMGRLWVGTSDGLFLLDGPHSITLGEADGLASATIRSVHEDVDGRIWVASNQGVDCAETPAMGRPVFAHVVTSADVTSVVSDRERSLWVGFRGHGLMRLQRSLFRVYDRDAGLTSSSATTVFQTRDGTVWAGAGTALAAIRGARVQMFDTSNGLGTRAVSSLAEDGTDRLWVGTEAGLYRSKAPIRCAADRCDVAFAPVPGPKAFGLHIRSLKADGAETMLVGTSGNGLYACPVAGPVQELVPIAPGEVRAVVRESPDRLWVGTRDRGLGRVSASGVTFLNRDNGLPNVAVQALMFDREGTLWIGTRHGMAWIRDGRVSSITTAAGLPENSVYGIADGEDGRLWITSGSGVFTLSKQELTKFGEGRLTRVTSTRYGLEHGLPSTLCALSHDPVIMRDADGQLWMATLGGVVAIDSTVRRVNPPVPPVHIEAVDINQASLDASVPIEAPQGHGSLVFHYSAPSFVAPDRIEFRYTLEGFDSAWTRAGTAREARFTNIPPGRYRFRVVARNSDGEWNEAGASADLYLVPHFYQRAWFPLVMVVLGFGLVGGGVAAVLRGRERRHKAREAELARRVDESLTQIKMLRGLLPICAWCHRVRDDEGYWTQMEAYVREHTEAEFSHGLCPDCLRNHFPEEAEAMAKDRESGEPPAV